MSVGLEGVLWLVSLSFWVGTLRCLALVGPLITCLVGTLRESGSVGVVVHRMSITTCSILAWLLLNGASGLLDVGVCSHNDVGNAGQNVIGGAGGGHVEMHGKPCDHVANPCGPGFAYPDCVTSIRVPGRGNVRALHALWGPAATGIGFDVGQHVCARWGTGHMVKAKWSMDVGPRGQFRVVPAATKQIEGEFGLW